MTAGSPVLRASPGSYLPLEYSRHNADCNDFIDSHGRIDCAGATAIVPLITRPL
jgi:hypothetical protein